MQKADLTARSLRCLNVLPIRAFCILLHRPDDAYLFRLQNSFQNRHLHRVHGEYLARLPRINGLTQQASGIFYALNHCFKRGLARKKIIARLKVGYLFSELLNSYDDVIRYTAFCGRYFERIGPVGGCRVF